MSDSAFKDTDIGRIPCDWTVKSVASITTVTAGGTPSTARPEFWKEEIPWMRSGDIHKKIVRTVEGSISKLGLNSSSATLLPPNCVLIALAGQGKTRGTVAINEIALSTNQSIAAVYPTAQLDSKYLYYYLDSKYEELRGMSQGDGGRGGLNLTIIGKINFPYPDLPEQNAIATALSDIDALIEAKKALLEKKRAIKQGAMQELLTGRRRLRGFPVTPMKKTDIGEIPEDWNVCKMGENGTFLTTASYTRSELSQYGDVACIHYGDIHTKYKTWLSLNREEVPHIDYSKVKNYPYLRDGDLIIADASEDYAGLSDWVELTDCQDKKCIGGLHTIVFRPIEDIFAFGYLGLISSIGVVKKQLISKTVGTKVYSLTASMLKDLLFPIPSTEEEQASIYNVIRGMDSEVKAIESEIEKLRNLKQGMMRELLTGRIRLVK